MPKYFFHVRLDGELIEDPDGVELPDIDSAESRCVEAIKEIAAEQDEWLRGITPEFHVVDELGRTVAVVPFRS